MKASEKLEMIERNIEQGKSAFISTALRVTKITPKTFSNWKKSGHDLLKVKDGSLYMAQGKRFVCIDYCAIDFK